LPAVFIGAKFWEARVICDPGVVEEGGEIHVRFGCQIGFGVLRPVSATLAK
jgi:hypothetical protein